MSDVSVAEVSPAANAERSAQQQGSMQDVKARIQAEEARMAQESAALEAAPQQPGTSEVRIETPPAPQPPTQTVPAKDSVPSGLRDKDGNVSEDKILKANEHLKKGIEDKEARLQSLLKEHKELRRKFGQTGEVLAQAKNELPVSLSSEEQEKKELEELEKNPVGYVKNSVKREINTLKAELDAMKAEVSLTREARELDSLVEGGQTWIATEGLGRFEDVFKARPYLLQSPTPYKDALRFMSDVPSNGSAPVSAQNGRQGLPILGGGHAAPPPSTEPHASTELKMSELSRQIRTAMQHGDKAQMARLSKELDMLGRGY